MNDDIVPGDPALARPLERPRLLHSIDAPVADRKAAARMQMLEGPIVWTLLQLALPTMSAMFAQTAVNIAEGYYIGLLGTDSLAGVTLVFPGLMLMTTMSGGGVGSGVASAVARAIGSGRGEDADAITFHALVLAIVFGGLFTVGLWWGGLPLFHLLGGRGAALGAAVQYANAVFGAAIAVWIVNLLSAALRGAGNTRAPAMVTIVGAIILIPASPALIFGFGPIPRLGIEGAGIAYAAYYVGAALVIMRYLLKGKSALRLRAARIRMRIFADILNVGLPSALNAVQTNLTPMLVTGAVGVFGVSAIAGYGIGSRLDYILIPIVVGLATSVLTMVGVNIGAGRVKRAKRIAWTAGLLGGGATEAIGLIGALAPGLWIHLFSREPTVVSIAEIYLQRVGFVYGAFGLALVLGFAAQGAGRVLWPFLANTARLLLAAGGSWVTVGYFGAGIGTVALIVAASLLVFAGIIGIALNSHAVWPRTSAGCSQTR